MKGSKEKSSSISLVEKPFDPKISGEWMGKISDENIFLDLYIKKKYNEVLHFFPGDSIILLQVDKKVKKFPGYKSSFHFGVYSPFSPMNHTYWYTPKTRNDDIFKNYFKKIMDTDKRFTAFSSSSFKMDMETGRESGHALLFLYDRKSNEVELFDNSLYEYKPYQQKIKQFFTDIYGKKIKIIYPGFCAKIHYLELKCYEKEYKYISQGFCAIWVLWYLDVRLRNLNKSRIQVVNKALKDFKSSPYRICEFIRGYSQFVESIVKDYKIYTDNKKVYIIVKKAGIFEIPKKIIEMFGYKGAILYYLRLLFGLQLQ